MRNLSIIASFIALTACGALNQNQQQANKPVVTEDAAKAQAATLPAVTIVRVPVGADGKEIHENAEIRLADQTNLSKDNVASTFDAAKAPTATVDELDGSSSTESYHGYRGAGNYYSRHHRHHGGYNGNWNWNFYRPTYYYYGYYYNWNYYNTYNCGGYNYYQYNVNYCGNYCYNGIGYGPGYGYSY